MPGEDERVDLLSNAPLSSGRSSWVKKWRKRLREGDPTDPCSSAHDRLHIIPPLSARTHAWKPVLWIGASLHPSSWGSRMVPVHFCTLCHAIRACRLHQSACLAPAGPSGKSYTSMAVFRPQRSFSFHLENLSHFDKPASPGVTITESHTSSLRILYDFPTSSEGWFLDIVDAEKKRQYTSLRITIMIDSKRRSLSWKQYTTRPEPIFDA